MTVPFHDWLHKLVSLVLPEYERRDGRWHCRLGSSLVIDPRQQSAFV